jgi:hypothetical protein
MMNKSCLLWTRVSCDDHLGMAHRFAGDGFALAPTPDQHPAYRLLVYALHQVPYRTCFEVSICDRWRQCMTPYTLVGW